MKIPSVLEPSALYMTRCMQLAALGAGKVAPNPLVGAVLVHENRIIGEGYHEQYGKAHAEVNCLASVKPQDKTLIEKSTLYVSLEPCAHFGKTPPCADLIIAHHIKKVYIGHLDPYKEVCGLGVEKMTRAGIEVITGVLENECHYQNRRFITFHTRLRPYIILKWAQSLNGKIGLPQKRVRITGPVTDRLVHRWRSEEAAILVGTRTVETDDPLLTTRLWPGKNPVRVVIDRNLRLPRTSRVFKDGEQTLVFNEVKDSKESSIQYIKVKEGKMISSMVAALFDLKIQSVLVEGGADTLQAFIEQGLWDEARVITRESLLLEAGTEAPQLKNFIHKGEERYGDELISYYDRDPQ